MLAIIYVTLILCIAYFGISFDIIVRLDFDLTFLNPIRNYEEWEALNWFGVGVTTILLNIICLPYAVCYWIYKLVRWMFTVGRQ